MRIEGRAFWADLAAVEFWGETGSLASLELGGPRDPLPVELASDRAVYRESLWLVADDLSLRGAASPESESWRVRLRAARRAERVAQRRS